MRDMASHMIGDNRANSHKNIKWRCVYNLCHLHSGQEGKGKRYSRFVRTYQVMLCNYRVFSEEHKMVEHFTFRNEKGFELCDAVMAMIIDLTHAKDIARKAVADMTDLEAWVVFFALADDMRYQHIIQEITIQKEGIAVANDVLLSISQDPEERAKFQSRRILLQDREHDRVVSWEDGKKEGMEEKGKEKDAEIAELKAENTRALDAKDKEIDAKDKEIDAKDKENEKLKAEIATLRAMYDSSK